MCKYKKILQGATVPKMAAAAPLPNLVPKESCDTPPLQGAPAAAASPHPAATKSCDMNFCAKGFVFMFFAANSRTLMKTIWSYCYNMIVVSRHNKTFTSANDRGNLVTYTCDKINYPPPA